MNTRKIEPGMLCLVVQGMNTGRECTTIRLLQPGESTEPEFPGYVDISCPPCWLVRGPSIETKKSYDRFTHYVNGYGLQSDRQLLPIQPDQQLHMTEVKKLKVPHDARELTET